MTPWRERLLAGSTPMAKRDAALAERDHAHRPLLNIVGGVCLAFGAASALFLVAIVFIAISGLADAFDGIVARVQEKSSRFGDFLDHCADRAGDSLLAACWLVSNGVRIELAMAGIIMTMLNGYIGTQIEATYGVRSYESVGRGEFVLAIIVLPIISYILFTNGWSAMHFAGLTVAEWLAAMLLVAAVFGVRPALPRRCPAGAFVTERTPITDDPVILAPEPRAASERFRRRAVSVLSRCRGADAAGDRARTAIRGAFASFRIAIRRRSTPR